LGSVGLALIAATTRPQVAHRAATFIVVIPAKRGSRGIQSQALGPRFRKGDELTHLYFLRAREVVASFHSGKT